MIPLRLVRKNLLKHKVRFVLTVLSLAVAIFLLCALRSLVVALEAGVKASSTNRLVGTSASGTYVSSTTPELNLRESVRRRWWVSMRSRNIRLPLPRMTG